VAVYSDGHKWCFGCSSLIELPKPLQRLKGTLHVVKKDETLLPWDVTKTIDMKGLMWLSQYDITREELIQYSLMWSPSRRHLIFPFYDGGNHIIAYQARDFSDTPRSKYFTRGPIEDVIPFNLTEHKEGGIIIVEDLISGIKVQRQYNCFPALGCDVSFLRLSRLKPFTRQLTFWLDYDKRAKELVLAKKAQLTGFKVNIIVTEQDPKCFNDDEIYEIVESSKK